MAQLSLPLRGEQRLGKGGPPGCPPARPTPALPLFWLRAGSCFIAFPSPPLSTCLLSAGRWWRGGGVPAGGGRSWDSQRSCHPTANHTPAN